jgi:hypothetical protein
MGLIGNLSPPDGGAYDRERTISGGMAGVVHSVMSQHLHQQQPLPPPPPPSSSMYPPPPAGHIYSATTRDRHHSSPAVTNTGSSGSNNSGGGGGSGATPPSLGLSLVARQGSPSGSPSSSITPLSRAATPTYGIGPVGGTASINDTKVNIATPNIVQVCAHVILRPSFDDM